MNENGSIYVLVYSQSSNKYHIWNTNSNNYNIYTITQGMDLKNAFTNIEEMSGCKINTMYVDSSSIMLPVSINMDQLLPIFMDVLLCERKDNGMWRIINIRTDISHTISITFNLNEE